MTEHTWTEGKGLRDALPDIDWPMRKLITVYPHWQGAAGTDSHPSWSVQICWGDTWGHFAMYVANEFDVAMRKACESAIEQGCPAVWLPIENYADYIDEYKELNKVARGE